MRKKLEFQANRIESALALHQVDARVTGGTVTPRWVRFQVLPAESAKIGKIKGLSEEMAAALEASSCRVSRRGAAVAIEVPRDDPRPVRLLPLYDQLTDHPSDQPSIPPTTAILGLAEDGAPLLIRLPSPDVAHVLVAGASGAGKTTLLQTMILSLAMSNPPALRSETKGTSLVLIDSTRHALRLFDGLPHLARPVVCEPEDAAEVLQSLVRLMERRSGNERVEQSRVVVVIDELADLVLMGGKPVQRSLTRLTQRGGEVGVHVVAATRNPTAAALGQVGS